MNVRFVKKIMVCSKKMIILYVWLLIKLIVCNLNNQVLFLVWFVNKIIIQMNKEIVYYLILFYLVVKFKWIKINVKNVRKEKFYHKIKQNVKMKII